MCERIATDPRKEWCPFLPEVLFGSQPIHRQFILFVFRPFSRPSRRFLLFFFPRYSCFVPQLVNGWEGDVVFGVFISSESGDVCSGTALSCRLYTDLIYYVKPEFKGILVQTSRILIRGLLLTRIQTCTIAKKKNEICSLLLSKHEWEKEV